MVWYSHLLKNFPQFVVIHRVLFVVIQARLHRYMNSELPDGQAGFRKGRGTREQIANMEFSRQEYWSGLPFSSSRGSSPPRDQTCISCIGRRILYH